MRAEPVSNSQYETISELHLTSCEYRAAVFDVTSCKTTETLPTYSFIRLHGNFYSDLTYASSLELTKYYWVNCPCSAVAMPIRLSSYATWNTSDTVISVQLPSNSMFFCHAEIVSHMVL